MSSKLCVTWIPLAVGPFFARGHAVAAARRRC
jgi:hypothetical protein